MIKPTIRRINVLLVQTPIIPTDKCGVGEYARFEYTTRKGKTQVNQNQICAGKLDTGGYGVCNGDSGGPLMCEDNGTYYITGIVSWSRGCAEKNAADVLTNVEEYLPWISKTIQDSFKVKINSPAAPSSRVKHVMCDGRKTSSRNGIILSQGWPKEYKEGFQIDALSLSRLNQSESELRASI